MTVRERNVPQSVGQIRHFKNSGTFGFPPKFANKKETGIHCHPGMETGYKHPRVRSGKPKRLPNVKPRSYDFHVGPAANGFFYLKPPYPPRVNRTIDVNPPGPKNHWPTKTHKDYPLRWKHIEYLYEPRLMRKPLGDGRLRWTGAVTRIEHLGDGKKAVSLESHDARLLENYDDLNLLKS